MRILYHPIFLDHDTGHHPENRKRLESLGPLPVTDILSGEKFLTLVHHPDYIEYVKKASSREESLDPDTITSLKSYESAVYAAGAVMEASLTGGMAVVRPPGHHAYPDQASGFCLFNNIAISVQKLVNDGKRVLILDFDGHCGDGTEYIFYQSDQVLFLSTHQYPAFPGKGWVNDLGEGKGKGYTINIPLPPGSADDLFIESIETWLPAIKQFDPDIVAISAGFDAHHSDPLLQLNFSANVFYWIGQLIRQEFKNRFAVLEGGYNLTWLPRCFYNFLAGVNGEEKPYEESSTGSADQVRREYKNRMDYLRSLMGSYWKI